MVTFLERKNRVGKSLPGNNSETKKKFLKTYQLLEVVTGENVLMGTALSYWFTSTSVVTIMTSMDHGAAGCSKKKDKSEND